MAVARSTRGTHVSQIQCMKGLLALVRSMSTSFVNVNVPLTLRL